MSEQQFQVVIAGGGMVGASLGCALAQLPLRVAVVEPFPFASNQQPSFDLRTTALSRSSHRILSSLGVWSDVQAQAAPIRRIHVSQRGRFGTAVIDAHEQGIDSLGFVLENRQLGAALWDRLDAAENVTIMSPARIDEALPDSQQLEALVSADGAVHRLRSQLLVVADGARSQLRATLGIGAAERSYAQSAIVGTVQASQPGDGVTAYERFMADGPMALLPAGGDRYVFVLTRHEDRVQDVLALDDREFTALLQDSFGYRLGRFTRIGKRAAYPLSLVCADRVVAQRAAIIGNAAHGLHPVAGQGYNLGLRDVAALAECIADELNTGHADLGSPAMLDRYARWRRIDQRNVVAFTDGLVRLFDVDLITAGAARGMSLALFDVLPPAKRILARHTMGLGGKVPRLARGLPL